MAVHPLAVVSSHATISRSAEIGPFCVIEAGSVIGPACRIASRAVIKQGTRLGAENWVGEGAILGGMPQHLNVPERPGLLIIGSGNTLRENVTIHRALDENDATLIGDDNLLMVNAHVAHDCHVGNNTIFANNVMLAGHVSVADRAYLSGAAAAHQFCRIGTLAMVGGQSHVTKDVPPFVNLDGLSSYVVGLNQIGLRRAGYQAEDVRRLKQAYRVIYRSGLAWNEILARLQAEFSEGPCAEFYRFLSNTTRGITPERRPPPGATIRLRADTQPERRLDARAG